MRTSIPPPPPASEVRNVRASGASRDDKPIGCTPRRLTLLALFALTSGLAGPLWAAGNVSNLSLSPVDGLTVTDAFPSAQGFTTGNHSAGYTLKSVTLKLKRQRSGSSPTYTQASLYSASSENPGTSQAALATLNLTDANAMADYVFSCTGSGCELDSGTTYFIVVGSERGVYWGQNTSGSETNTPSDAGWSIADVAKYKSGSDWPNESPAVAKLMKVSWAIPTLTATSIEATSATLGIANHTGNWHYKQTAPTAGQCSAAVSAATTSVGNLDSGASHTFKAYSDSACATEITSDATDAEFLTKPGKVAGVSATPGNASLDLSWTAETGAASYKIQWKSGTQEYDATNRQATSTAAAKTISSLTNGTAHTLRVAAVNATGDGAWSDETTATPSSVTLAAGNVSAGGATLTLSGHTAAWHHKYTTPAGGRCSPEVPAGTASATLTDLRGGTSYTFKAYGDSACSTPLATAAAFTTSAPAAPSAPTNLSVRGNTLTCLSGGQSVTSFFFTLDWDAANANGAPVAQHRVFWRKKITPEWTLKTTQRRPGATIGIAVDSGNLGGTYEVGVRARNSRGWGPRSATADFTLSTPPAAPAKPTVSARDQSATLAWTAPSGCGSPVTGYEYAKKTGSAAFETAWTAIPSSASLTAHTVTGLTNNTAHQFKLRAVNAVGKGPASPASDSVTPTPPDLWVENVTPSGAVITIQNLSEREAWSYKLGPAAGSAYCYSMSRPRRAHPTGTTLSGLSASTQYAISAYRGRNCDGSKLWDSETFTTLAANAQLPTLSVSAIGNNTATLNLANHTGDWWYMNELAASSCTKVDSGTYTATLSSLEANTPYFYTAYSNAGCANSTSAITWWDQVTFNTTGPISATITDYTSSQVTLAVSGVGEGKWSYQHRNTNTKKISGCTTHDASTTSVIVWGLTSGTPYEFHVYRGADCEWPDRVTLKAHTISLSAGAIGQTSATLTLGHYEGAWSYKGGAGSGGGQAAGASAASGAGQCQPVPSGTHTAQLAGLSANTGYAYTAHAGGNCSGSALGRAQFTTAAAGPPARPASVAVTRADGTLGASWPAADGATSYHVTHTSNGGASWTLAAHDHPANSISIAGVDDSLAYIVGVRARNARGDGAWRNSPPAPPPGSDPSGALAMHLAEGPSGHLFNLSAAPASGGPGAPVHLPLLPAASDPRGTGLLRIANRSDRHATLAIQAFDDAGRARPPLHLALPAGAAIDLESHDLESGNPAKRLSGALGTAPPGRWRLRLSADADFAALAYARHPDGLLSPLHNTAPARAGVQQLPFFPAAPDTNANAGGGLLRLANPGNLPTRVTVSATDDAGDPAASAVSLDLPPRAAAELSARDLERGAPGLSGALGDGAGHWRLSLASQHPLLAMSLMEGPSGHLSNLSPAPANRRRAAAPPHSCPSSTPPPTPADAPASSDSPTPPTATPPSASRPSTTAASAPPPSPSHSPHAPPSNSPPTTSSPATPPSASPAPSATPPTATGASSSPAPRTSPPSPTSGTPTASSPKSTAPPAYAPASSGCPPSAPPANPPPPPCDSSAPARFPHAPYSPASATTHTTASTSKSRTDEPSPSPLATCNPQPASPTPTPAPRLPRSAQTPLAARIHPEEFTLDSRS